MMKGFINGATAALLPAFCFTAGCAHYPVNSPMREVRLEAGDRGGLMRTPENSDSLLLYFTFSGGGMRAAALSYGVLEELRKTEIVLDGRKRWLLVQSYRNDRRTQRSDVSCSGR